jgi:hypothetical protein
LRFVALVVAFVFSLSAVAGFLALWAAPTPSPGSHGDLGELRRVGRHPCDHGTRDRLADEGGRSPLGRHIHGLDPLLRSLLLRAQDAVEDGGASTNAVGRIASQRSCVGAHGPARACADARVSSSTAATPSPLLHLRIQRRRPQRSGRSSNVVAGRCGVLRPRRNEQLSPAERLGDEGRDSARRHDEVPREAEDVVVDAGDHRATFGSPIDPEHLAGTSRSQVRAIERAAAAACAHI